MVVSGFIRHAVTVRALIKSLFTEGMDEELSEVIGKTLRSCQLTDAELAKALVEINHKEGNMDAFLMFLPTWLRMAFFQIEEWFLELGDKAFNLLIQNGYICFIISGERMVRNCKHGFFLATIDLKLWKNCSTGLFLSKYRSYLLMQPSHSYCIQILT